VNPLFGVEMKMQNDQEISDHGAKENKSHL